MNWFQEISEDKYLYSEFFAFLDQYGLSGLRQALLLYSGAQEEYICKTRVSISKLKISDIYCIKIKKHNISVYTEQHTYQKYGTLSSELSRLVRHGFIRCSQNCIVSLEKIKTIRNDEIILKNNIPGHMSRNYAPKVIIAFAHSR